MTRKATTRCALTIAGSDSGGGAGIQADLSTFAAFNVHGVTAVTCLTAQNPDSIDRIEPVKPSMVRAQIESALTCFRPAAAKIGILYSAKIVEAVIASLQLKPDLPLIVDPILVSSSGIQLLQRSALHSFKTQLLPLATLMTPNIPEAETLAGRAILDPEDMRAAVRDLYEEFGCAVLLKGGHGRDRQMALDVYYDGREEFILTMPRIQSPSLHGTGCTLSAAITSGLARGEPLLTAIRSAKEFTARAIASHRRVGGKRVLSWAVA